MVNDYISYYSIDYTIDHASIMISDYSNDMLVVMLLNNIRII